MGAHLGDFAVFQDHDPIGKSHPRKPVGDDTWWLCPCGRAGCAGMICSVHYPLPKAHRQRSGWQDQVSARAMDKTLSLASGRVIPRSPITVS
jgi:hypothetical protein